MTKFLPILQIILSLFLIGLVLLQPKGKGFGGGFQHITFLEKKGVDLFLFRLTIFLAILFLVSSIIQVVVFK